MPKKSTRASPGPCAKAVAALFGTLFLVALLSVPVTTKSSRLRQDPESNIVVRTTYPRNTAMFLPTYLSTKARSPEAGDIEVRSVQWIGTMGIIIVLGVFDYFIFCRLLKRKRRILEEP